MKRIRRVLILIAITICILLLSQNKVEAMTQEEAGAWIANYARNYMLNYGAICEYDCDSGYQDKRGDAYKGIKQDDGMLHMDCVGFVSIVLHGAIGLDDPAVANGSCGFIAPDDGSNNYDDEFQEIPFSMGAIKEGDILANSHHVMVYVGNGEIIHCDGHGDENNGRGAISYQSIDSYYDAGGITSAYRLKDEAAAEAEQGEPLNTDVGGPSITDAIGKAIRGWFGEILPGENDDKFPIGTSDKTDFYYKGLAELKSVEEVQRDKDKWVFPSLSSIADWMVSAMIKPIVATVVGWGQIVQVGASIYVANISGETTSLNTGDLLDNLPQKMKDSLTLEKLVYNQVPLFDVDVFNSTAGGKTISSSSITGVIRALVANWYYSLRIVSIIALLLILIYLGIKAAISTSASDKAEFKEMLVNWLVAFIVVFFMHYILIFVMKLNESLVEIFANIGKQLNPYYMIRELTWSTQASTSIMAAIIYLTLVYYLIKFIVIYLKRLFITLFLIIIAPLVAGKYGYDKIKGKKGDTSLGKWVKEYVFSVGMQAIHALVYTIFVSVTINMITSTNSDKFAMAILALMFFHFMTRAEKILRNMLKLAASAGTDFGNVDNTKISDVVGWQFLYARFSKMMRPVLPMYRFSKQYISNQMKESDSRIGKVLNYPFKTVENMYVKSRMIDIALDNGKGWEEYSKEKGKKSDLLGKRLDNALREEYHMKIGFVKDVLGTAKNVVWGMGKSFIGIPIFVAESPWAGAGLVISGISTVLAAAGKPIKGYKKEKNRKYTSPIVRGAKSTMLTFATVGLNHVIGSINEVYGQKLELLKGYKPEEIRILYQTQMAEMQIKRHIENMRKTEFKGFGNASTEMERKLSEQYEQKLITNLEESQKTVSKPRIRKGIEKYQDINKKFMLGTKDLTNIAKKMQRIDPNDPKNDIIIRNEVEDNIKAQVQAGMITELLGNKPDYKSFKINDESIDAMVNKIKKSITKMNEDTEEAKKKKQASELVVYLLEQEKEKNKKQSSDSILEKMEDKAKEFANEVIEATKDKISTKDILKDIQKGNTPKVNTDKLPEDELSQIKEIIQENITNKEIDNTVGNLNVHDLTKLLKNSINMEGSIKKEKVLDKFKPIIEEAEKLRDLNDRMKELSNPTLNDDGKIVMHRGEATYSKDELINMVKGEIRKQK